MGDTYWDLLKTRPRVSQCNNFRSYRETKDLQKTQSAYDYFMVSNQTKCFRCYKELSAENEKAWLENDGLCPNCSTPLSVEDETCYNCDKPAIQEDEILFCLPCFELVSEGMDDDE